MKVRYIPDLHAAQKQLQIRGPGGPSVIRLGHIRYALRAGLHVVAANDPQDVDIVHGFGVDSPKRDLDVLTMFIMCPSHLIAEHPYWWDEFNELMIESMQRSKRVIACSHFTAAWCKQYTTTPVQVIPQPFDHLELDAYSASTKWRKKLNLNSEPLLVWPKTGHGPNSDITPAIELARRCPHVVVAAPVEQTFAHAPANFVSVGTLERADFLHLLASSDVFLNTKIEGGSVAHLEAMYLGKPILGYQCGADVENTCGICVPDHDLDALTSALDVMLADLHTFSTAARIYAQAFTYERLMPRILRVYDEILAARSMG